MLVSMPALVPLVILRGSGPSTAELARLAAESGVRTLAHAEGGGVLYVHEAALHEKALALADASLDRLGVCNRLNLALVDRAAVAVLEPLLDVFRGRGLEVRGDVPGAQPLDEPLGHEWASDPDRVGTVTVALVDGLDEAVRIANEQTSGLAAGIVTEDAAAAERFLDGYRGTAAFWNATDEVHRRLRADGLAGDGDQRRPRPRPARPGHLPRPLAAAVPRGRRRNPDAVTSRRQAGLEPRRRAGRARAPLAAPRARAWRSAGSSPAASRSASSRRARSRSGCRGSGSTGGRAAIAQLQAASALGQARLQAAWDEALAPLQAAQVLLTAADVGDRTTYVNASSALAALLKLGAVPVVNENDATATDEITFGDNDALAAQVAVLVRARLLVLLTEVEGVYSRAPGTPGAELLDRGTRRRRGGARRRRARSAAAGCGARCWPPSSPPPPGSRP